MAFFLGLPFGLPAPHLPGMSFSPPHGSTMVDELEVEEGLKNESSHTLLSQYDFLFNLALQRPQFHNLPKILCHRSMILLKMKQYTGALNDAVYCIRKCPMYIRAYWRAAQVMKDEGNLYYAINELNEGLKACLENNNISEDLAILYAEMVTLLCKYRGEKMCGLIVPSEESMKVQIIKKLISYNRWEEVNCLVNDKYLGGQLEIAKSFSDLNFSFISIDNLLKNTSPDEQKQWSLNLAIILINKGASIFSMEFGFGMAAIHIGIKTAFQTGNLDFLKYLLSTYIDCDEKKNMIDQNGDTAVHVVVKSGKTNETIGEAILRLLINHGCSTGLRDMSGKIPIEYLGDKDIGFSILQSSQESNSNMNSTQDETVNVNTSRESNASDQTTTPHNSVPVKQASPINEDEFPDPTTLQDEAYNEFREGRFPASLSLYTKAIEIVMAKMRIKYIENHELAVLLEERSKVYLKMNKCDKALDDANKSVLYNTNWAKAYIQIGKVCAAKGNNEGALKAYTDAMNVLLNIPEQKYLQIQILASYSEHYMNLRGNPNLVPNFKINVGSHVWAMVAYDMISKGKRRSSFFPFIQSKQAQIQITTEEKVDLQPLCKDVKKYPWCVDLVKYFLLC